MYDLPYSKRRFAQNITPEATLSASTDAAMVGVGSRTPAQISRIPGAVWVIDKVMLQQQPHNGADLKQPLGQWPPA